jgi:hypothetical protein
MYQYTTRNGIRYIRKLCPKCKTPLTGWNRVTDKVKYIIPIDHCGTHVYVSIR